MTRTDFWIGLAAVAFAAAWIFLLILPSLTEYVRFEAENPWAIGNSEDAFAYAGEGVHIIQGTASLDIDRDIEGGIFEIELSHYAALAAFLDGENPQHSIVLRMRIEHADDVWADRPIHGHSGIGDSRLPEILALYAGSGSFELLIAGKRQPVEWQGVWSIGNALRQSDGSIRDQGLVFSPLLRDQSGFSDPDRMELTLLLYDAPESNTVILHLVFPNVRILSP